MPRNTKPPPPHTGNIGPQRRTLEKLELAERAIVEAKGKGKPLAKEILEDAMLFGRHLMGKYQPGTPAYDGVVTVDDEGNTHKEVEPENRNVFWRSYYMTVRSASALAPYQSPTYRAVAIIPEVIGQAEVSEQEAREKMRQVIAGIAPEILEDEPEEEPELVMTNGGGR